MEREQPLDACLDRVRGGQTIDDALAEHAADGEALRPLLDIATRLESLPDPNVSLAGLMNTLGRLGSQTLATSRAEPAPPKVRWFSRPVWTRAAAIVLVNPPGADDPRIEQLSGEGSGRKLTDAPVVHMSYQAASKLMGGMDLLALLTGSEGLLGVVTEVKVKLLPRPEVAQVIMAGFDSIEKAGDAVGGVISHGIIPGGLEMMDGHAIVAADDFCGAGYPRDAKALLLCEVDGTEEEVHEHIAEAEALFGKLGATSIRTSQSEEERALLWKGRKSAFPAVGRISPDYYCMDGTIPRRYLAKVLLEMEKMSEEFGLRVANVFHAGDGNLHPLILFDANVPGEFERTEAFGSKILELCVEVGGCITGEHGVGVEKIRQMAVQFNDDELQQFHDVKAAFDPTGILNPGKGVPTLKFCQEYRSIEHKQHKHEEADTAHG